MMNTRQVSGGDAPENRGSNSSDTSSGLAGEIASFADATIKKMPRYELVSLVPTALSQDTEAMVKIGLHGATIRHLVRASACFDDPKRALNAIVKAAASLKSGAVNKRAEGFAVEIAKFREANNGAPLRIDEFDSLIRIQLMPPIGIDEGQSAPPLDQKGGLSRAQREKRN